MDEMVTKLIRKHRTNCPFSIARAIGIQIRFTNLGKSTKGLYFRKLRRRFIVIHSELPPEWQRFVCAHELGHDRLHKGINRFFWRNTPILLPASSKGRPIVLPFNY